MNESIEINRRDCRILKSEEEERRRRSFCTVYHSDWDSIHTTDQPTVVMYFVFCILVAVISKMNKKLIAQIPCYCVQNNDRASSIQPYKVQHLSTTPRWHCNNNCILFISSKLVTFITSCMQAGQGSCEDND